MIFLLLSLLRDFFNLHKRVVVFVKLLKTVNAQTRPFYALLLRDVFKRNVSSVASEPVRQTERT